MGRDNEPGIANGPSETNTAPIDFLQTQRDHGNSIVRRALNALCFFLTL
jgi:hypothetical protein